MRCLWYRVSPQVRHVWRPYPMQRAKITNDGIKPQPVSHHVRIKNAVCPSQAALSKNHNGLSWRKRATYPKSPKATPKTANSLEICTVYMDIWYGSCRQNRTVCAFASLRSEIWVRNC